MQRLGANALVSAIWAGTDTSLLITPAALYAAQAFVALTDATTVAVDLNTGINFKITLAGNRTLGAPTNLKNGQAGVIRIKQDTTGTRTLAYSTSWKFPGGTVPTLSTAAGAVDRFSYVVVLDAETAALRVECTALEKAIA